MTKTKKFVSILRVGPKKSRRGKKANWSLKTEQCKENLKSIQIKDNERESVEKLGKRSRKAEVKNI